MYIYICRSTCMCIYTYMHTLTCLSTPPTSRQPMRARNLSRAHTRVCMHLHARTHTGHEEKQFQKDQLQKIFQILGKPTVENW